jgi:hypothetical protein
VALVWKREEQHAAAAAGAGGGVFYGAHLMVLGFLLALW